MKILHLATALDFGGVESCLQVIAEESVARAEHHVFASLGGGGFTERAIRAVGGEVHCLGLEPSVYSLPTLNATYRLLRGLRPDVLHTHGGEANFHGLLAAWLARVPVRVGEEIGIPWHTRKARVIFRWVYRTAHVIVAVSEPVKRWLVDAREAPDRKIAVVNTPARLPQTQAPRAEAPDGPLRIGFLGRLVREKNLPALLDALAMMRGRGRTFRLILIGDGPMRSELEDRVRDLRLSSEVEFAGFVQAPDKWVRSCDIFVLPSYAEGSSLALLEAMAMGLPALVTPVGIAPDVVEERVSGWIAKSPKAEDLAEKLNLALQCSRSTLLGMGEAARASVSDRFRPDCYIFELHRLYSTLYGRRRRSRNASPGTEAASPGATAVTRNRTDQVGKARTLRILHCLENISWGGVEQRRLLLARGLDGARFQQRILCTRAIGPLAGEMREAGMPVDEIGAFRLSVLDPQRYRRALKVIRDFRPHIIHGAVFEGTAVAMVAGGLAGVPVKIAEETSDPVDRTWRGHLLIKALFSRADVVIGVSPAVAGYLQRLGITDSKRQLIWNSALPPRAIPIEQRNARRAELRLAESDFVAGTVARLDDDHKRVSDLIDALARTGEPTSAMKLLIVGDGPDRAALEARARAKGVGDRCRFVGFQRDTSLYYSLMDVFVLASSREAFGLVLAEAMMAGLPVVGTNVGGIPHVLDGGSAGLLVPPFDPAGLAGAIQFLRDDPVQRRELAARGKRLAESRYRPERYIADITRLYESLAEAKL
jgi:glycosyltransferase involved in cell wall biosynthesis